MTKSNMPTLRFYGFDGEWETHPLNKLGSSYGGLTGKTKNDFGHGAARYITYLDVFEHAVIRDARELGKTEIDNRQAEVNTGDALFTVSSEVPEEVGMSAVWLGQGQDIYLNSFCFGFRPTAELDSKFLAYVLRSPDFREKMGLLAQGISRFNISKPKAMEVAIGHPTLEEQRAIGDLFTDLDTLIEQHRAKHANLQQTKTALMQRMFPRDGADEPELRLGGFSVAWQEKPLKDLGSSYGGLTGKTKEDFGHGDARYITYLDVFDRALINDGSQLGVTDIDNRQNEVKTGDVLFTVSSEVPDEVGMSAVWLGQGQNIYLNSFCFGFRPTAGLDSKFLAYVLRSPDFREQMSLLAQGVSRFNISKKRAMELEISFPALEEQRAIGEVFSNLDALIAAEASYITQLIQAKTALLQRMFV